MAVTNIHAVKKGVCSAIEYITDPTKTNDGFLVTTHLCVSEPHEASQQFADIRLGIGGGKASTKAQHIIQSFAPGEVTPELALLIGQELCYRLLNDNYQYVLAVHNDHDHVHCHIVFNNVNSFTGNTFETEYNQGKINERKWAKLREISDEVCRDFGLSVIENPKGKGVSHYERDMQNEGKSWKEKLRHKLSKIIFKSEDFDDFLRRCGKKNIEVVYTPEKKVKLKFRMEGQQRFVRADTLGEDYLPEKITENIALIKQAEAAIAEREALLAASKPVTETAPITPKAEPTVEQKPIIEPVTAPILPEPEPVVIQHVTATEKPKNEPVTEQKPIEHPVTIAETKQPETVVQTDEKNEDPWSAIRGMRNSAAMIAELEQGGVMSYSELSSFNFKFKHKDDHTEEVAMLKKQMSSIDDMIEKIDHSKALYPIFKEHSQLSGWKAKRYEKKHSEELADYRKTKGFVNAHLKDFNLPGNAAPVLELMTLKLKIMDRYNAILPEHNAFLDKKDVADKYRKQTRKYVEEQIMKRRREISNQKIKQKKKGVWLE